MSTVLVVGATGRQGGAVARALLSRGHAIRALSRDPASPRARALAERGVEVVAGDLTDAASLAPALADVHTVFAMGTPFQHGIDAEVRQGETLVAAARTAGVQHVVYTSVAGANARTGIPHFESKRRVELAVQASGLEWTVLAPVYFMENLFFPQSLDAIRGGVYASALPGHRAVQQVAVADIGAVGALAVEGRLRGRRVELAGDEIDGEAVARALTRALGRPIAFRSFGLDALRGNHDLHAMYTWFDEVGYSADISGLRRELPEVGWHRFDDWLAEADLSALR